MSTPGSPRSFATLQTPPRVVVAQRPSRTGSTSDPPFCRRESTRAEALLVLLALQLLLCSQQLLVRAGVDCHSPRRGPSEVGELRGFVALAVGRASLDIE